MRHLIITVGTGSTVAHGIRHAIGTIRPDRIYYLVTEESERKTLPEVRKREGDPWALSQEEYVKRIEGKDQLDQVFRQVYELIQVIRNQDPLAEIYLDYTSGTKVMSAGAVLAACLGGVDKMTYVSGERESNGRVVSGTESVLEQPLVHFFFEDRKRFFFTLFDRYDFIGCYAVLEEIHWRSPLQKLQDFVMLWEPIVRFYHQWDLFDHGRCEPRGVKGVPARNKKFLGKLRSGRFPESDFCRLADLFNNAQRRSQEGRFDDAVARLYRAMEFVAQLLLKGRGIDTSNVDLAKIPEALREKYQSFQNDKGVVQIPLFRSFELLSDLGEPLGKQFFEDHELQDLLRVRNSSILAHGIEPVSEEIYLTIREKIFNYAKKVIPLCEELCQEGWFPSHDEILQEFGETR